ncbi:methyl-CpG binding domain protein, partial [Trifolium pratense]
GDLAEQIPYLLGVDSGIQVNHIHCETDQVADEFNHVAVNSEIQSDSVGLMCPVCQAKVPLQINVLENGSPNAGNL